MDAEHYYRWLGYSPVPPGDPENWVYLMAVWYPRWIDVAQKALAKPA